MSEKTIYIASRPCHAPSWRNMRSRNINFVATWIDAVPDAIGLAEICIIEAQRADYTILYNDVDSFKDFGSVEVGAALGAGKKVIVVGDGPTISPAMLRHPNIQQVKTLGQAFALLGYIVPSV